MKSEERPWILASHLGTLLGYAVALGSFLVPLFIWLSKKEESELIASHARESLNFQLSMLIYTIAAIVLSFLLIGLPLLIVIPVFNIVCVVIAAIKADKGEFYHYPLNIRFIT